MGKTEELSKDIRDNIDVLVQVYKLELATRTSSRSLEKEGDNCWCDYSEMEEI